MRVLGFASYPIEAAASRYRLYQFVEPLRARGITLTIRPFIDSKLFESLYQRGAMPRTAAGLLKSAFLRLNDVREARKSDVILVQREAMIFGPPLIEWLGTRADGPPLVLDLDDATYVPYTCPTFGRLGKALKWFSKTDDLIRWARLVICGNRTIADYVSSKGTEARIIPTVVDMGVFRPRARPRSSEVVLGWVGTHSTFHFLESIFPTLEDLARRHELRLKIVGSGKSGITIPGLQVDTLQWKLEREAADFQSFDIGLYPIVPSVYGERWTAGKSGFKAIQYMAVGIAFVASPMGAISEIGIEGKTHFCASTQDEWRSALKVLIEDYETRNRMGAAGREYAVEHYGLEAQTDKLADALRTAASKQ